MNAETYLNTLVNTLAGTPLPKEEITSEIARLLIWKYSQSDNVNPTLETLLGGESELSKWMGKAQIDQVIQHLNQLPELPPVEYLEALLKLHASNAFSKKGMEILPNELAELMLAVANLSADESQKVYIPFIMSLVVAIRVSQQSQHKVVMETPWIPPLVVLSSLLTGFTYSHSDPLKEPSQTVAGANGTQLKQFEHLIMFPPFGMKLHETGIDRYNRFGNERNNGDVMVIQHALSQCVGRIVTLCTHGLLFRAGSDYDLRYSLIKNGWVDAIIQLPSGLLFGMGISLNILVLDKHRNSNDPIFFYDADRENLLEKTNSRNQPARLVHWQKIAEAVRQRKSSEFGQLVSRETILENQCNLSVRRYISDPAAQYIQQLPNTRPLSGIATLIRSQVFKEDDVTSADEFLEVGLRDIALSGEITPPNKKLNLSGKVRDKAMQLKLLPGDILLSIKGNVGQVGIVGEQCGNNWVAGQIFVVIRPNREYLQPAYLYRYLASPVVQQYLSLRSEGSAVPILQATDLNNLPVPVGSSEEQANVVQTHVNILAAYERILGLEKTIQDLKQSHWC